MAIAFDAIPITTRAPLAYTEFGVSRVSNGLAIKPFRALLVGQRTVAGSVQQLIPTRITAPDQAQAYFGVGSQVHRMAVSWFANNRSTEVWAVALDDAAGSVAAVHTIVFSGLVTVAGTISIYIDGIRAPVPVNVGATGTPLMNNIRDTVNLVPGLPVVATVNGGALVLTARNAGAVGNDINVRLNYNSGEATPTGLTASVNLSTSGHVSVTLGAGVVGYGTAGLIAALGSTQYDVIALGHNDNTNLLTIEAELTSRWGPARAIEGMAFAGLRADLSTALTFGATRNSQFLSVLPQKNAPHAPWDWAAAYAARVAFEAAQDPNRPMHTVPLSGMLAPAPGDRFITSEQELLLHLGLSTYQVDQAGGVAVNRAITTYQTNATGALDDAFLDIGTHFTLAYLRYDWRTNLLLKYPRHKLASDGFRYAENVPIMTPERGRAEAVARFGTWLAAGYVEDIEQFKRDLIVERNPQDPTRLDFLMPINLVNGLQVIATRFEFQL